MIASIMLLAALAVAPQTVEADGLTAVVREDGALCFGVLRPVAVTGPIPETAYSVRGQVAFKAKEDLGPAAPTHFYFEHIEYCIAVPKWADDDERKRKLHAANIAIKDQILYQGISSASYSLERSKRMCLNCSGGGGTVVTYRGLRDAVGYCHMCQGVGCVITCRVSRYVDCPPPC